eukprot:6182611-Pleurochrysis_carterae.AAC.1
MVAYATTFYFYYFYATIPDAYKRKVAQLFFYGNAYFNIVFIGKTLNFRGRAIDANCHGHVGQIGTVAS